MRMFNFLLTFFLFILFFVRYFTSMDITYFIFISFNQIYPILTYFSYVGILINISNIIFIFIFLSYLIFSKLSHIVNIL